MCAISVLEVRDHATQSAVEAVAAPFSMAYALSTSARPGYATTMTLRERSAEACDLSRLDVAAVKAALDALSSRGWLLFGNQATSGELLVWLRAAGGWWGLQ